MTEGALEEVWLPLGNGRPALDGGAAKCGVGESVPGAVSGIVVGVAIFLGRVQGNLGRLRQGGREG